MSQSHYSQQPGHAQYHPPAPPQMRNGLGTSALVLGIVGTLVALIPIVGFFGLLCGVIGVVLSTIGLGRVSKQRADNKGVSIAGLVLSVLAVIVSTAIFISFAAAVSTSATVAPADGSSPTIPPPAGASAPAVFEAGQGADSDGLVVTVSPLEKVRQQFTGNQVCTSVTYQNGSSDEVAFNLFDWELKNPANVIVRPTFTTDRALSSGSLAPGGNVAGRVCFDEAGAAGQYEVLYSSSIFGGRQITWRASL